MRNDEQLVSVEEIAGTLNVATQKVIHHAGEKNVVEYYAGLGAVTLSTARRVASERRSASRRPTGECPQALGDPADESFGRQREREEREVKEELEAAQRRAAARQSKNRHLTGVQVSVPGTEQE
jgi:hypothetical protein